MLHTDEPRLQAAGCDNTLPLATLRGEPEAASCAACHCPLQILGYCDTAMMVVVLSLGKWSLPWR